MGLTTCLSNNTRLVYLIIPSLFVIVKKKQNKRDKRLFDCVL